MTVLFGFADAVGSLLCEHPDAGPIAWLAVGRGDPAWDQVPPAADRDRRLLTDEVARVPLIAGQGVAYRPQLGVLELRAVIGPGVATGPLRELGVFAGRASARPGTGTLVSHRVHDLVDKGADESLVRELRFTLDPAWPVGARHLIGALLAGRPGVVGLRFFAGGTSAADPPVSGIRLAEEAVRRPLERRLVNYDPSRRTVEVEARLGIGVGPPAMAEIGVLGGDPGDGSGTEFVALRAVVGPIDRTRPVGYRARLAMPLVARSDITVPELVGRALTDAAGALRDSSLARGTVTRRPGPADAVDQVLEQAPDPGTITNEGRPIDLVVGAPAVVLVPSVRGLSEAAATAAIGAAGFTVAADVVETPAEVVRRIVTDTDPPAGSPVDAGSTVRLHVAVPRRVEVPDLRGRTVAAAGELLVAVGLRLSTEAPATTPSSGEPGTVVDQDPPAGRSRNLGSTVKVTTAEPWTVTVPDLAGVPLDGVARKLEDAAAPVLAGLGRGGDAVGLTLGTITMRPDAATPGTVVAQDPAAGAAVYLYRAVDVVVATARAVTVPDVRGRDQVAAATALTAAGLVLGGVRRRASRLQGAGSVLEQRPLAGEVVASQTVIDVVVSSALRATVPDVVGSSLGVAAETLKSAGYVVDATTRSAGPEPGVVLAQAPGAGALVNAGITVSLTVAVGVPAVVGRAVAEARAELESLEYVVAIEEQAVSDGVGLVVGQDPAPNTPAAIGTQVVLIVGVSADVVVPDLIGLTPDQARSALAGAVLSMAGVSTRPQDAEVGLIVDQDPPAGTTVGRGSSVSLVVAVARAVEIVVPELVGLTEADARQRTAELGLTLTVVATEPTAGAPPGIVVRQVVAAGSSVAPGTEVGVVLASAEAVIEVPSFTDRTFDEASRLARDVGLRLVAERLDDERGTLIVVRQKPAAGTRVPFGIAITVAVAVGHPMPNFVGQSITDVRPQLERAGFTVVSTTRILSRLADGTIVEQHPEVERLVVRGSRIDFVVAQGLRLPGGGGDVVVERPPFPDRVGPVVTGPVITGPVITEPVRPTGPIITGPVITGPIRPVGPVLGGQVITGPLVRRDERPTDDPFIDAPE